MKRTRAVAFHDASRRAFLQRAAAVSATGVAPWAINLAAIGEAAAQNATDYKALVCVFLYGGNDHANTLVPYDDASHAAYSRLRGGLATPRAAVAPTLLQPLASLPGGRQFALAPQLAPLKPVFDAGAMSVVLNVGTLVVPTTKAQYNARSVPLPPHLLSHNDQQSVWQAGAAEGASTGWGGRMADLVLSGNGQAIFTAVSVSGNAVFLSGRDAVQYQVTSNGSVAIDGIGSSLYGSSAAAQALRRLVTNAATSHVMQQAHTAVVQRSIDADAVLRTAVASSPTWSTPFPATNLAGQLAMVARMIAARDTLRAKRQVFFVGIGGFDTHDSLASVHSSLLQEVGDAIAAFYAATRQMGVAQQVTTFTASDFGRTLTSNGDGTDHGWGGYQFVVGDAVRGQSYVGKPPEMADNGPDDIGLGRLVPTTAVQQLAASLATWMGVSSSMLDTVVPGVRNFDGALPIFR
jgi:uncharacterized protein (DUF1501 family)